MVPLCAEPVPWLPCSCSIHRDGGVEVFDHGYIAFEFHMAILASTILVGGVNERVASARAGHRDASSPLQVGV